MNDAYKQLLSCVSNNDLTRARDVAKVILRGSKTAKDAEFCNKLLERMDAQDQAGIEIPYNLKNIIQTKCSAYAFLPERYYLSEREAKALEHIKRMYATGERLSNIGIHYPNTALLYGKSGTGKTTFAQYVAHELDLPFLYISLTQMIDSLLGKTGQNMELAFNFISSVPCVAVIDEIDAIGTRRAEDGTGVSGELKRVLISVMENLDKLPNNVVLIAATNRPQSLDDALMRRFRLKHEVAPLSKKESEELIAKYLGNIGLPMAGHVDTFLATTVSERESVLPFEETHTPAAILDCLNERIAMAFESSNEERPIVVLLDEEKQDRETKLNEIDIKTSSEPMPVEAIHAPTIGIPEEYRWRLSNSGGATRNRSPIEHLLEAYQLEEFPCPCCGEHALYLKQQEGTYDELDYWVGCSNCNWDCASDVCYDNGEAIADFRTWYAAWIMLGRPDNRVNEDLSNEFEFHKEDV